MARDGSAIHLDRNGVVPFHHYTGITGASSKSRSADAAPRGEEIAVPVVIGLYADPGRSSQQIVLPAHGPGALTDKASNIWGQCKYRNELVVDRVNLG